MKTIPMIREYQKYIKLQQFRSCDYTVFGIYLLGGFLYNYRIVL
jgi:hypothetical protein